MAEVKNHVLAKGFSGTIGRELTFRQIGGRTFVSKYQKAPSVPPTEKKLAAQKRFGIASAYARRAVKDPLLKAVYQTAVKGAQRAFNIAVIDALHAPVVENIQAENYKGIVDDPILVRATDNFKVARVVVSIADQQGIIIEQGDAIESKNENEWVYYTKQQNAELSGILITAVATDLPGNSTSLNIRLQ